MTRSTENLLFSATPENVIKRTEVRMILVRNRMVIEERYKRVGAEFGQNAIILADADAVPQLIVLR